MRSRVLPAVGLSVAALALATTFAPMASASHNGVGAAHKTPVGSLVHTSPAGSCYAQLDNDNGVGIVSQNFETSFDAYDAQGADDFALKKKCAVTQVEVNGTYFNGAGPATSVNVTFYHWKKSKVKKVVASCPNASYTDSSGTGNFTVACAANLGKGKYWVSVQANLDFSAGGEWGWNTNNTVRLDPAMWQNPGNGFGTGCTKYADMTTCLGAQGQGGDFAFAIN